MTISFEEALNSDKNPPDKRSLLLGNGFSIAWKPDIFQYGSLFDRADFSSLSPKIGEAFDALATTDFEHAMKSLSTASKLVDIYHTEEDNCSVIMREDAEKLKDVLVDTIAKHHPELPSEITPEEYTHCRRFLSNFQHRIFTLNYDLLLYWVLMHDEDGSAIICDDGFRTPDGGESDYVAWDNESASQTQTVYYLHGALHLFDGGHELKKFTWINTRIRLIQQIRTALNDGLFPLIVTEGTAKQKMEQIYHHVYLGKGLRSFSKISGSLYIFGHSLSEADEHIINLIPQSNVNNLCVGLFDDPSSDRSKEKIAIIDRLVTEREVILSSMKKRGRSTKQSLSVVYFDAKSAHVWR